MTYYPSTLCRQGEKKNKIKWHQSTVWLQAPCISNNTHVNRSIRCQSNKQFVHVNDIPMKANDGKHYEKQTQLFFCRFYWTLLNISLRRFALSDIYKVKCSFWFLTTVHLHGRRIHRAYRQTSWRLCAHGVDVHMYIYNFSLFFFFFFLFTYTIYMSTCARSRCHSSSHAVQNNHMATLGVMTVTGWWAFTKRTVGRAGCLATKKKKKKQKLKQNDNWPLD